MVDGSFHSLGNAWFRFRTNEEDKMEVVIARPGMEEGVIGVKQ